MVLIANQYLGIRFEECEELAGLLYLSKHDSCCVLVWRLEHLRVAVCRDTRSLPPPTSQATTLGGDKKDAAKVLPHIAEQKF